MDTKDKDQTEQQDKGFAVHDKRRVGKEDSPETESPATDSPAEQAPEAQQPPKAESPETETTTDKADREPGEDRPEPETGPRAEERPYGPLTFTSFIMSLSTSALIYLGQFPDPVSGKTITDLAGARQTIDLISLLKEKTEGNLTPDETGFIDTILYDLRMLFVKANS
ncbi:MAG: DUF1844 domain-containing protein [Deltaproteobacteria bacterium]|nr:DUF1844 domain-containing protein [Candidatus Zymogenaceae bacterium]